MRYKSNRKNWGGEGGGRVSKGPLCCKEKCQENGLSVGSEVQDVRN